MNAGVRFQDADAYFLWLIPPDGRWLVDLLGWYCFVEREAVPPYGVVANFLAQAVRAGAIPRPTDGFIRITPGWHAEAHAADDRISPSELSILDFAERLVEREYPELDPEPFVLDPAEYESAVGGLAARDGRA